MSAIAVEEVVRTFGAVMAVDHASLAVEPGEVVGLLGANGAGKTTLIKLILGLLHPDHGTVMLAGGAPGRETRRLAGYVPQGLGLWTDLTLREHLALVRDVYGSVTTQLDAALTEAADVTVGALPLGLRRRAAFAVALSHDPQVVILDEPTSGVDPLARSRLWDSIRDTADRGAAVLVSTHYLEEAGRCDRVVLLSAGRVVAEGTVNELTAGRSTVAVSTQGWQDAWQRLEDMGMEVLPAGRQLRVADTTPDRVRKALDGLDAEVATVPATLEEVFLQASRT